MMQKVKIYVAAHKPAPHYGGPTYQLIHVGSSLHPDVYIKGSIGDNEYPDNISTKNDIYCELTALYYIWKNVKDIDVVGLCHYRRLLGKRTFTYNIEKDILTANDCLQILSDNDIILQRKSEKKGAVNGFFTSKDELRKYRPFVLMGNAIRKVCPEYYKEFEKEFFIKEMSYQNIMVCKKTLWDKYCEWLFSVLFQVEVDLKKNGGNVEPRELGFYSEWLLNVWVRYNNLKVYYTPIINTETPKNIKYFINYLRGK